MAEINSCGGKGIRMIENKCVCNKSGILCKRNSIELRRKRMQNGTRVAFCWTVISKRIFAGQKGRGRKRAKKMDKFIDVFYICILLVFHWILLKILTSIAASTINQFSVSTEGFRLFARRRPNAHSFPAHNGSCTAAATNERNHWSLLLRFNFVRMAICWWINRNWIIKWAAYFSFGPFVRVSSHSLNGNGKQQIRFESNTEAPPFMPCIHVENHQTNR